MSLNKVTLIGNLGKDPEIRATQDGREIASFSLATSESNLDTLLANYIVDIFELAECVNINLAGEVLSCISKRNRNKV